MTLIDLESTWDIDTEFGSQSDWGTGPVATLVHGMPTQRQRLLKERFIDDLAQTTMAEMRGISVSAVSQQLKVTLGSLRQSLVAV